MPLVKNSLSNFKIVDNHVELQSNYLKNSINYFKKITGSRFSSILGFSQYTSPFKIWFAMTNLFKDVIDPTLAYVGNTIEPKVRDYVCNKLQQRYKVYNPQAIGWDVFKDNKIFGGIPDGEPINSQGIIDYSNNKRMLEIKTSSIDALVYKSESGCLKMQKDVNSIPLVKIANNKRDGWFNNGVVCVSDEYKLQLGLYLYLRNQTKGLFAICFLQTIDYAKPEQCDVNQREIKLVNVDYDLNKFKQYIDYAKHWYEQHISTGKSPDMTEQDKQWLEAEMRNCY